MHLIKSISGIRGTIGGAVGQNLTPVDIVEFVSAYAQILIDEGRPPKVVIGRDGRISGPNISELAIQTLLMMGLDVIDIGLSTTPTVEMEVVAQKAGGGIIVTASHNNKEWNALKFFNAEGEFISGDEGIRLLHMAKERTFAYAKIEDIGTRTTINDAIQRHIDKILGLDTVDHRAIAKSEFTVVVDCINSTGAISIPPLLDALGCKYILLNKEITGDFAHNPEPLQHHLQDLSAAVITCGADMGLAVDPDVDRLALIDENGNYCGEEYTLVMVADWVLSQTPGATVSNLSSTIVLKEITENKFKSRYEASAVGEVNVVAKMKEINALIGGEGNGGIIYPTLHAGRDALVGIALILTALAHKSMRLSQYRKEFPEYIMTKKKIELMPSLDVDQLLQYVYTAYADYMRDRQDGIKIYFDEGWAHLRKSNTEPIIRLIVEATTVEHNEAIIKQLEASISNYVSSYLDPQ